MTEGDALGSVDPLAVMVWATVGYRVGHAPDLVAHAFRGSWRRAYEAGDSAHGRGVIVGGSGP
jgi:hypothetical protein